MKEKYLKDIRGMHIRKDCDSVCFSLVGLPHSALLYNIISYIVYTLTTWSFLVLLTDAVNNAFS